MGRSRELGVLLLLPALLSGSSAEKLGESACLPVLTFGMGKFSGARSGESDGGWGGERLEVDGRARKRHHSYVQDLFSVDRALCIA